MVETYRRKILIGAATVQREGHSQPPAVFHGK
jgi:hypothetical protein